MALSPLTVYRFKMLRHSSVVIDCKLVLDTEDLVSCLIGWCIYGDKPHQLVLLKQPANFFLLGNFQASR